MNFAHFFSSKMSLLFQKAQKKLINQIFQQKTQTKEIQDPRISLGQNLKKKNMFVFFLLL
jgi:hypothetical protein